MDFYYLCGMKKFALIGHPVAGSMSPVLFSAAYGGRFAYDLIDEAEFSRAWERGLEYDGFNVTAPYKRDAARMCEGCRLDAVNLVIPSSEGCRGYNTDIDGVIGALGEVLPGALALIVGTGGAASAAYAALKRLGCRIVISGRSLEKAKAVGEAEYSDLAGLSRISADIIVYTLPGSAPVPSGLCSENAVVLEAEYRTPRLEGLDCARYISGKQWLLHQGIAAYRIFTGEEPDVEAMNRVFV
jgi:shikimate dehydrogenase